jgi:hypothetical protein
VNKYEETSIRHYSDTNATTIAVADNGMDNKT